MKKSLSIDFSGVRCHFDRFGSESFWDEWQWRLDPFKSDSNDKKVDLVITQKEEDTLLDIERGSLVYTENSNFFEWNIYFLDDHRELWIYRRHADSEAMLAYVADQEHNCITLIWDHSNSCGNAAFTGLNKLIPGFLLQNDILTFHAALLEYHGYSFAVCADSGVGKTTHARLWRDVERALIINGDRMICKADLPEEENSPEWISYSLPWSGTSGECINRSNPLKAIVVLERGTENHASVVQGFEAFQLLFPHLLYPGWDIDLSQVALSLLDRLLQTIPVIRLKCKPNAEAVSVLKEVMERI